MDDEYKKRVQAAYEASFKNTAKGDPRKPKAPCKGKKGQPENAVVNAGLDYLRLLGCYVWKNKTGAFKPYQDSERVIRYGKTGSGDIVGMTPRGTYIEGEGKYGNNKQSEYQIEHQKKVESHGGIYILFYSVEDIEKRKAEILA
jgi:hypothetical protein